MFSELGYVIIIIVVVLKSSLQVYLLFERRFKVIKC